MTVFLCCNADGSEKLRATVINNIAYPVAFRTAKINIHNLPVYYRHNKKGWMLSGLWYEFLNSLNERMRIQDRHIILLADNAPTHPSPLNPPSNYTGPIPSVLSHVRVYYLPPNTTAFLQPLDGGIIASFKATYRRLFAQYYVDHFNSHDNLAPKLDALQAIHLISKAWDSIPSATIFHCWQQVGIVGAMDRELVGKFKEYLNDIQVATTISVASMLTLDADIEHNRVTVLDSGVDTTTNKWLSFDEDAVIHDKDPAVIPVSLIIQENKTKLLLAEPSSDEDTIDPSLSISIPPLHIPTISEAVNHLDELTRFFQSLSISTLDLPHSSAQVSISDFVDTIIHVHEGLKHHQHTHKVQTSLKDFWNSGSAN